MEFFIEFLTILIFKALTHTGGDLLEVEESLTSKIEIAEMIKGDEGSPRNNTKISLEFEKENLAQNQLSTVNQPNLNIFPII